MKRKCFKSRSNTNPNHVNDGCYSRAGIYKTYDMIVSDSIFMRVPATLTGSNPMNIVKRFPNARMMSVSWDDTNSKHVVSGCKAPTETSPFKNFIGALVNLINIPNTNPVYTFSPSGFISSEYTNKHILSGNGYYSDGIAYLIQDLRDTTDALWVMKVNYLNGNVYSSNGYLFDAAKTSIIDAAHNFNSLFILGHHNGLNLEDSTHFESRYISQINIYDSTDFITKHMMDVNLRNLPWVSTKYLIRQVYLNNIIYNHYTSFVQASGAVNPDGMMVETFDMTLGTCDSTINNYLINVDYADTTYNNFYSPLGFNNVWVQSGINISSIPVTVYSTDDMSVYDNCISMSKSASYFEKHEQIQQLIKEKQELYQKENRHDREFEKPNGQITVIDNNQFVCSEFEGACNYKVFDLYGRLISEGITENGKYHYLNINRSGMYLISVKDSNNNVKTKKIVISE
ncbi:MAG: T9SS type A sorting domain-containing protein [Bacteroidales bacterium]|nr:T9SS type A sorting domain-containing protein [Bacteroidales bacterium]